MLKIKILALLISLSLIGCASNPNKIDAAYVSPLKYKEFDCEQIALEMEYISRRTNELYNRLKKERTADNWQMGVGLLVFWPSLFLLEGGDGPEANEYARVKGEFNVLRESSVRRKCAFEMKSPDELIKEQEKKDSDNEKQAHIKPLLPS